MRRDAVVELVDRICAVGDDCADRSVLQQAVADLRRVKSWCQAGEVRMAKLIAAISSFPEKDVADAAGTDLRDGLQISERAKVTDAVPEMEAGMAAGDVTGVHVDIVGDALRDLEPGLKGELMARAVELTLAAASMTPHAFRKHVQALVRKIQADDGMSKLEQQRRATRLRFWVNPATGMGHLAGEFDPVTFATLERRVNDTLATRFAETVPDSCPSDPLRKQDHLRALALAALVRGEAGGAAGRPEVIVVIDTTSPNQDGRPSVDWGIPIEVPLRVLAELVGEADVHTIVVRNGIIIHATGTLDLGRSTRVANRAQRRVLRGLYATCGIPGCATRYDHCALHHIIWWRHGGRTDLANLVPLCSRHHHDVHDNGWQLAMTDDRTLTIVRPDSTRQTTGPPKRNAA